MEQEERNLSYDAVFGTRRQHVRLDQGGLRPGRNRCTFKNERTTPRPIIRVEPDTQCPPWIRTARQFCQAQEADYRPVLYTDGSYSETNLGLRSVFDRTAVTRVAGGSIVAVHAGEDWKERPIFNLGIRQVQDIQVLSTHHGVLGTYRSTATTEGDTGGENIHRLSISL